MGENDRIWGEKLKRRLFWQPFDEKARAAVAAEIAAAIGKKDLHRLQFLLLTPFTRALSRTPLVVDAENIFAHLYGHEKSTPLALAVIKGFDEGAKLLLQHGALPFKKTEYGLGYTGAISAAIFYDRRELMADLLLHKTAQEELKAQPGFRNYLLHAALGTDNAATLSHLLAIDPEMAEKGVVYGDRKAADFTLGTGVLNRARKGGLAPK